MDCAMGRSLFLPKLPAFQGRDGYRLAFDLRSKAFTRDSRVQAALSRRQRVDRARCGGAFRPRAATRRRAGPTVRIRLPPADSPSLAGFLLPVSKTRQLPRRAGPRPSGTAGRDSLGSLTPPNFG